MKDQTPACQPSFVACDEAFQITHSWQWHLADKLLRQLNGLNPKTRIYFTIELRNWRRTLYHKRKDLTQILSLAQFMLVEVPHKSDLWSVGLQSFNRAKAAGNKRIRIFGREALGLFLGERILGLQPAPTLVDGEVEEQEDADPQHQPTNTANASNAPRIKTTRRAKLNQQMALKPGPEKKHSQRQLAGYVLLIQRAGQRRWRTVHRQDSPKQTP